MPHPWQSWFRRPRGVPDNRLGTFLGVFTPTVLTILGVIMYLRLGWVTGHMGLGRTLLIVVAANAITFITTLAFSAIATNIRVGVGGAYYILSRSLGLEIGGAVGVPLYLSQVFSITLYAFGLAESLRYLWPGLPVQGIAFVVVLVVGLLALRGAGLALKAQIPILVLIAASLLALAAGAMTGARVDMPEPAPPATVTFWAAFAVFFPAVTGIMAGLGLSGDLREPHKAIPRGSLAAMLTGFAVYMTVPVILAGAATPAALRQDPLIWTRIALLGPWLVLPGLWGAIFSSAVGSMLGAPRTLQALALDGLAPSFLGKATWKGREPLNGILVSLGLALAAVGLGDLNAVAPVVTMFFLTVYGTVNIAAALESLSGDPSWRPRFRPPWAVCLLGGLGCFGAMFLIHPPAALAAVTAEILLWLYLTRRESRAGWGDVRRGVYESLVRWALVQLARRPMTPRNWRPHILVFVDDVEKRLELIRFGTWFSQGRGVVTVCELVVGDLLADDVDVLERERRIQEVLDREGLVAFGEVDVVRDVIGGMVDVAQANGMAGVDSNTVLIGWPRTPERLTEFLEVVRRLERIRKSTIIGKVEHASPSDARSTRTVDVWWGGLQRNGDLMLLLAHLLTRNPEWRRSRIRVLSLASNPLMKERTEDNLSRLLQETRIQAEPVVMEMPRGRKVQDVIHEESAGSDVVLLGLNLPSPDETGTYARRLMDLAGPLRTVFFVRNSSLFVGRLVQDADQPAPMPDEPPAASGPGPQDRA